MQVGTGPSPAGLSGSLQGLRGLPGRHPGPRHRHPHLALHGRTPAADGPEGRARSRFVGWGDRKT